MNEIWAEYSGEPCKLYSVESENQFNLVMFNNAHKDMSLFLHCMVKVNLLSAFCKKKWFEPNPSAFPNRMSKSKPTHAVIRLNGRLSHWRPTLWLFCPSVCLFSGPVQRSLLEAPQIRGHCRNVRPQSAERRSSHTEALRPLCEVAGHSWSQCSRVSSSSSQRRQVRNGAAPI